MRSRFGCGPPRDVLVRAPAATTVRELARVLADHTGVPGVSALHSDRVGRLAADSLLGDGVILDGDILRDRPPGGSRAVSGLELCIVAGPGAGRRVPLSIGESTIGRDPTATVRIDDRSVSRRHARLAVGPGGVTLADAGSRNGTFVDGRPLGCNKAEPLFSNDHSAIGRSLLQVRTRPRPGGGATTRRCTLVEFNRMPRMVEPLRPAVLDMVAPPEPPPGAQLPLAASAAPLAVGVGISALAGDPTMLLFSALSPLMSASTYVSQRRGGRRAYAARRADFRAHEATLREALRAARSGELAARRELAPDLAALATRA